MTSRDQILRRVVRSDLVRRTYGPILPIPGMGTALQRVAHSVLPAGTRVWIRIPQGLGAGLWMFADMRVELGYASGRHELWMQDLLKSELESGDCYYDFGAHTGFFSLIAARQVGPLGAVLAVEPNPENAKIVEANVVRNRLPQVIVLEAAIWSSHGQLVFESASNSTLGLVSAHSHAKADSSCVPAVCLDDLVFRDGYRPPDLIKMDVEDPSDPTYPDYQQSYVWAVPQS